jgi:hypothetical protein
VLEAIPLESGLRFVTEEFADSVPIREQLHKCYGAWSRLYGEVGFSGRGCRRLKTGRSWSDLLFGVVIAENVVQRTSISSDAAARAVAAISDGETASQPHPE